MGSRKAARARAGGQFPKLTAELASFAALVETELAVVCAHLPRTLPAPAHALGPTGLGAYMASVARLATGAELAIIPAACFGAESGAYGSYAQLISGPEEPQGTAAVSRLDAVLTGPPRTRPLQLQAGPVRLEQILSMVGSRATIRVVAVPYTAERAGRPSLLHQVLSLAMRAVGSAGYCQVSGARFSVTRGGAIRGPIIVGESTVVEDGSPGSCTGRTLSSTQFTAKQSMISRSDVVVQDLEPVATRNSKKSGGGGGGGDGDSDSGSADSIEDLNRTIDLARSPNTGPAARTLRQGDGSSSKAHGSITRSGGTSSRIHSGTGRPTGSQRATTPGAATATRGPSSAFEYDEAKCLHVAIVIPPHAHGHPSRVAIDPLFATGDGSGSNGGNGAGSNGAGSDNAGSARPLDLGPLLPGPPLAVALRRDLAVRAIVTAAVGGDATQAAARVARRIRGIATRGVAHRPTTAVLDPPPPEEVIVIE
jgi:hypothetical protein